MRRITIAFWIPLVLFTTLWLAADSTVLQPLRFFTLRESSHGLPVAERFHQELFAMR